MSKESKDYKNMPKKIYIRTFGCQMNERDSEFIEGLFLDKGYKLVDSPDRADIILINTCSVRARAEERAISNMQLFMSKHKGRVYGIVGCGAQALKEKLFKRLPRLDIVCGTGEIAKLPELVKNARKEKVLALDNEDKLLPEINSTYRKGRDHAYVSIMRGCNNFCSYCIVPYVRGRERSRNQQDIIREVKNLVSKGIENITLLGQNVNSYSPKNNYGESKGYDFTDLLKDLNKIEGVKKITFMTSHPKDASVKLFKTMRDLDKVVKHLHLPLQSGSDRILKLMERGYAGGEYTSLVQEARKIIPGLRLTTDIIIGFPSEKDTDFSDTLGLVRKIRFDLAYIFKYSPRPGTKANCMEDDVADKIKSRRHKALLSEQKEISRRKKHEKTYSACSA